MDGLGFRVDRKITEVIQSGSFTVSAEVIPPRNGSEQEKLLLQIQSLIKSGAQFLSVTKGAGGSLRGGSLPIAQSVKERFGVPCIAHFTCRDLTPQEVENQLMDHHYFGIRNILALRGDPPTEQTQFSAREGSYQYAYELISQIRKLNEGEYLARTTDEAGLQPKRTNFCIGAAAYPEHLDDRERLEFFRLKVDAGAEYGITQMIFDAEAYARFMDLCAKNSIFVPVLPGTRVLKNRQQAMAMAQRFQVSIPASFLASLPEKDGPYTEDQVTEVFLNYMERLKALGAPGVHLFVLFDTQRSCKVIQRLAHQTNAATEPSRTPAFSQQPFGA